MTHEMITCAKQMFEMLERLEVLEQQSRARANFLIPTYCGMYGTYRLFIDEEVDDLEPTAEEYEVLAMFDSRWQGELDAILLGEEDVRDN